MTVCIVQRIWISIHALRVEGDVSGSSAYSEVLSISIHALRVEGDPLIRSDIYSPLRISIHALRVEGDYYHSGII